MLIDWAFAKLLFALGLYTSIAEAARKPANSVLLSSVKTLTLRQGQKTSARRVSAVPQLNCIGGNAKTLYDVDVMRCKNAGADYDDDNVQWTCQASLPPEFKLGSTDVICEGYDSPEDPYILKGSCGVEYRLVLTEAGEEKYGRRQDYGDHGGKASGSERIIFGLCVAFIASVIGYGIWQSCTARQPGRQGQGWGGHWGGGGGDDDNGNDPPPPYTPRASKSQSRASQTTNNQQWRPGFWTGTAAGAAAGYMAGNRNSSRAADPMVGSSRGANRGYGGTSGGGLSSNPSPSNSRYESTGFGETRRR